MAITVSWMLFTHMYRAAANPVIPYKYPEFKQCNQSWCVFMCTSDDDLRASGWAGRQITLKITNNKKSYREQVK